MGYQLIFRDAPKAYLEDDTPNATQLVEQLLADMAANAPKDSVETPSTRRR